MSLNSALEKVVKEAIPRYLFLLPAAFSLILFLSVCVCVYVCVVGETDSSNYPLSPRIVVFGM